MKAILKFNLPDDQHEFECAVRATEMASALWDIEQKLRELEKWGKPEDQQIDQVRACVRLILDEYNIDVYKLMQ
jgi:hypothetical protein